MEMSTQAILLKASNKDERVIPTLQSDLESIRLAVTQAVSNVGSINFQEITTNFNALLSTARGENRNH